MKLGILFGGNSLEHEISIISAFQLKKKLMNIYNIIMIYIDDDIYVADKMSLDDFKNSRYRKLKKTRFVNGGVKGKKIDVMILSGHGENSEDGIFAAMMRFYNIRFIGCDLFASSLCINKYNTYKYLNNNGINMINSFLYTYEDYINGKKLNDYPCIVKPITGGSSIGIFVIKDDKEFKEKIIKALDVCDKLLIQKYYDNIIEYNLALDDFGYSKLEKIVKKDDIFSFNNKYNESFKQFHQSLINDNLADEFKQIGRRVYELLNCNGIIRIDFFLIDGLIYVNEVNTTPGALAMYLYDDFINVIEKLINDKLLFEYKKYGKSNFLKGSKINK